VCVCVQYGTSQHTKEKKTKVQKTIYPFER
jgi:hypothetical protein